MRRRLFVLVIATEPSAVQDLPSALYKLAGVPLLSYILESVNSLTPDKTCLATTLSSDIIGSIIESAPQPASIEVIYSPKLRTKLAAVLENGQSKARKNDTWFLTYADGPLLTAETASSIVQSHRKSRSRCTILTGNDVRLPDHGTIQPPLKSGGEAQPGNNKINNSMICCIDWEMLTTVLKTLPDRLSQKTFLDEIANSRVVRNHRNVLSWESSELYRVRNPKTLAQVEQKMRGQIMERLMLTDGVFVVDPDHTYVSSKARIGRNTRLFPNVHIEGSTLIGKGCEIRSGSRIENSTIGNNVVIKDYSIITDSEIADGCSIGPFSNLRMNARLEENVVVGNFVEVKKSHLGRNVKSKHLTYLGDAAIGRNTNIGAGTVTCNYDGVNRQSTVIGENVRIGAGTMLVAPVRVESDAITAAGSVVIEDVESCTMVAGVPATVKKRLKK